MKPRVDDVNARQSGRHGTARGGMSADGAVRLAKRERMLQSCR